MINCVAKEKIIVEREIELRVIDVLRKNCVNKNIKLVKENFYWVF